MNKLYNSFLTSFGLICRIPVRLKYKTDFSMFGFFFPLIGLIVSALVLGLFAVINPFLTQSGITVFLILIIQYGAFNLFHFDGLLDCADAFFYNTSRKKRLEILTDKRTGSFALFAGSIYVILKFFLLTQSISILASTRHNWLWIFILFSYPLSGRIAGAIMPAVIPPAEDPGLAELLEGYSAIQVVIGIILSLLILVGLVFLFLTKSVTILFTLIPFPGAIAAGLLVSMLSKKMVGGYTGDSIGLSIEMGEILHLIVLAEIPGRLF